MPTASDAAIVLARQPLRSVLRDALSERITSGVFPPGTRLNESDIARELGVSQTPIREALLSLEGELGIRAEPRRGFRVMPMTAVEAEELYTVVGHMERWALERMGKPSQAVLDQLRYISVSAHGHRISSRNALALDAEWHEALFSELTNNHLVETLNRLKRQLRRYEVAYLADSANRERSWKQHRAIQSLLRRGLVRKAARQLELNWLAGIEPMVRRMAEDPVQAVPRARSGGHVE